MTVSKTLFENQLPLVCGVSYNSYLIVDEKVALIDTADVRVFEVYLKKIRAVLGDRKIDYLIVNHMGARPFQVYIPYPPVLSRNYHLWQCQDIWHDRGILWRYGATKWR